jgi:hypothetical protein
MFINKMDEYIDNVFDKFFNNINKNKNYSNILKNKELYKNHKIIEDINNKFIKNLINELKQDIKNNNNLSEIISIIKKYIYIYIYLDYGISLEKNNYINEIIQIKKFNDLLSSSEIISILVKYQDLINKIIKLTNIDYNKISDFINKNKNFVNSAIFLNDLGYEYTVNHFKGNKNINRHNIIKTVIFREIYKKFDKKKIHLILNNELNENDLEYKFIEIIVPRVKYIDYNVIEDLLSKNDTINNKYLYKEIYNFINDFNKPSLSNVIKSKLEELFNKGIIVPILDDFLRYNKDTEKYDKNTSTKINLKDRDNKKDNTKIRYIVTKMNKISDLYCKKVKNNPATEKEILKQFYQPLIYRKAVIINELEELNIIKKLKNQGRKVIEQNEFYNDLINIRKYPYVNFKDFKNNGFKYKFDKTITSLRYSNFEFKDKKRFTSNFNKIMETRVTYNCSNIVGIYFNNTNKNFKCTKLKDTYNIHSYSNNKTENILNFFDIINKNIVNNKYNNKGLFWIFNSKRDFKIINLSDYQNISSNNYSDAYLKVLFVNIYDRILSFTYQKILKNINKFNHLSFYDSHKIIHDIENKLLKIPKKSEYYFLLQKLIYFKKYIKTKDDFDVNENKIGGIHGKIIKLKTVKIENSSNNVVVYSENLKKNKDESTIDSDVICQHFIDFDKIKYLKRIGNSNYSQLIYEFIKKYLTLNKDGEYICKSCFQFLDIKKYVTNVYNDGGLEGISININTRVNLDELKEYQNFSKSIKNIDKIIERIAYLSGLTQYIGSLPATKLYRQDLIKSIIDILQIHNITLRNNEKKQGKRNISNYNINKNLTNFFYFKLEDSIFVYSSNEIDKYKKIKLNNIFCYILLQFIININPSHILQFPFDKFCNFYLFEKYGLSLFDNLLIKINNKNDVTYIKKYKLLCFVIYFFSCIAIKYDMWYSNIEYDKKKFNPILQKMIIHTFVDLINSILEVNSKKNKNFLYDIISKDFLLSLKTVYSNKEVIRILTDNIKAKIKINKQTNKLYFSSNFIKPILLNGQFSYDKYRGLINKNCVHDMYNIIKKKREDINLSNYYSDNEISQIYIELKKNSNHMFTKLYNTNNNTNIDNIDKIFNNINSKRIQKKKNLKKENLIQNNKFDVSNKKSLHFIKLLNNDYNNKSNDIKMVINEFLTKIVKIVGESYQLKNRKVFIKKNKYLIDHDYLGNSINPIYMDSEKVILENNVFFKKDVFYYKNRNMDINVYYDAVNLNLLGYKERNKNYVVFKNTGKYIKIEMSLKYQIDFLGYTSRFIDSQSYVDSFMENNKTLKKNNAIKKTIFKVLSDRLINLKKSLETIKTAIYRLKYSFSSLDASFIKKYTNKIKKVNISKDDHKIFKSWKLIKKNLFLDKINFKPENFDKKYIYVKHINIIHNNNNLIIFYILKELSLLLDYNNNKYSKAIITNFIIELIDKIHNQNFKEILNSENKKFKYRIMNDNEYYDFDPKSFDNNDLIFEVSTEQIEINNNNNADNDEKYNAIDGNGGLINEDYQNVNNQNFVDDFADDEVLYENLD